MTVELTDEQYGAVMRALVKIARARTGGNSQKLSRDAVEMIARETCDFMGWPYYGEELKDEAA